MFIHHLFKTQAVMVGDVSDVISLDITHNVVCHLTSVTHIIVIIRHVTTSHDVMLMSFDNNCKSDDAQLRQQFGGSRGNVQQPKCCSVT